MTDLQLFAFFILPVLIVVGAGIILLVERRGWRVPQPEPDLFDSPRPRSLANTDGLSKPSKRGR
jgi:hypothetical protein